MKQIVIAIIAGSIANILSSFFWQYKGLIIDYKGYLLYVLFVFVGLVINILISLLILRFCPKSYSYSELIKIINDVESYKKSAKKLDKIIGEKRTKALSGFIK